MLNISISEKIRCQPSSINLIAVSKALQTVLSGLSERCEVSPDGTKVLFENILIGGRVSRSYPDNGCVSIQTTQKQNGYVLAATVEQKINKQLYALYGVFMLMCGLSLVVLFGVILGSFWLALIWGMLVAIATMIGCVSFVNGQNQVLRRKSESLSQALKSVREQHEE